MDLSVDRNRYSVLIAESLLPLLPIYAVLQFEFHTPLPILAYRPYEMDNVRHFLHTVNKKPTHYCDHPREPRRSSPFHWLCRPRSFRTPQVPLGAGAKARRRQPNNGPARQEVGGGFLQGQVFTHWTHRARNTGATTACAWRNLARAVLPRSWVLADSESMQQSWVCTSIVI
jgi:hypothetical protein